MGWSSITPNMHLACHIQQCLLDFGPMYSFWLFSFERYNGIMASVTTNYIGMEIQLMNKFLQKTMLTDIMQSLPPIGDEFGQLKKIHEKYVMMYLQNLLFSQK